MPSSKQLLAAIVLATGLGQHGAVAHLEDDLDEMAPLGFMWPSSREWHADHDRTAPCGSSDGVKHRTAFPLTNGALALEQKQPIYDLELSISFSDDPTTLSDFAPVRNIPAPIPSLSFDHVCIPFPDADADPDSSFSSSAAGRNATIQLAYTSSWVDPHHHHRRGAVGLETRHTYTNETFYVCADITYVAAPEQFTFEIPCFNTTSAEGNEGHHHDDYGHGHDEGDNEVDDHEHDDDNDDEGHVVSGSGGDDGLSKQAIAGICIGSVAAVAMVAAVVFFLWRKDRRQKIVAERVIAVSKLESREA